MLETSFARFKDVLCDGVAVKLPKADKSFVVETAASINAHGELLLQSEGEEEEHALVLSQILNAVQRNYSTY